MCAMPLELIKKTERGLIMTEEQKNRIEDRINWLANHSYAPALSGEWKGIFFVLETLGYYNDYKSGEYKIVKMGESF